VRGNEATMDRLSIRRRRTNLVENEKRKGTQSDVDGGEEPVRRTTGLLAATLCAAEKRGVGVM